MFPKTLLSLALSNATRNRTRSILCVTLIASTTFLVLSISAFYLDPHEQLQGNDRSGSGGFAFIAETAFPVYADIRTPEGRDQLSIQPKEEEYLQKDGLGNGQTVVPMRIKDGDNASCLNLYQPDTPRILGVPSSMSLSSMRITWNNKTTQPLPLEQPITTDSDGVRRVPIILDANTAQYALHLYGGIGDVYEYDTGTEKIRCEIVGLLRNSILQGEILMSEENLLELFPDTGGYRFFLFEEFNDRTSQIVHDLLGDYGFQGEPTADRLRKLFAIQNTYLSTFQSLGGIGLLLGIFGLAVIQSRNVLERRKELALLQALGFSKSRTILLLLYESFTLLGWGLGIAVVASAFALLPFFMGEVQEVSAASVLRQFIVLVGSLFLVGGISNAAAALAVLKIPVARELAEEH